MSDKQDGARMKRNQRRQTIRAGPKSGEEVVSCLKESSRSSRVPSPQSVGNRHNDDNDDNNNKPSSRIKGNESKNKGGQKSNSKIRS